MPAGKFEGRVLTIWTAGPQPDRPMELVEDFAFIDPQGKRWVARAGQSIDGASIPRALWSTVGSPFTGDYRRASVIHDVYCDPPHTEPHKAVHRMFYDAMIADGVSSAQAAYMYQAVRIFGPKWDLSSGRLRGPLNIDALSAVRGVAEAPMPASSDALAEIELSGGEVDIDQLERSLDAMLGE